MEDPAAPEIAALIKDLADTLAHWRSTTGYGRGIAAPQIGISQRVIFLKLPEAEPWPLINPEIVGRSEEKIIVWDACLSFLSIFMQVERHRQITVRYQNPQGDTLEFRAAADRNLSELVQHKIDHLDGILAIDRVVDIKTICTREEFEKRYRDSSPMLSIQLQSKPDLTQTGDRHCVTHRHRRLQRGRRCSVLPHNRARRDADAWPPQSSRGLAALPLAGSIHEVH